jgi:hypothetical protein
MALIGRSLCAMICSMRLVTLVAVAAFAVAHSVAAQTHIFIGGNAFAVIKRFSGDPTNAPLDGTALGGGLQIGAALSEHWLTPISNRR